MICLASDSLSQELPAVAAFHPQCHNSSLRKTWNSVTRVTTDVS